MPVLNIVHVKRWKLTDEKTGEVRQGVNFAYLDPENRKDSPDEKGVEVITIAGDPELYQVVPQLQVPGEYQVEYGMTMKAKRDGGKQSVGTIKTLQPIGKKG